MSMMSRMFEMENENDGDNDKYIDYEGRDNNRN